MGNRKPGLRAIIIGSFLGILVAASAVQAASYEFANFNLLNADQPFSFTNNTSSATIGVLNAPITFNFTQQTGLSTADNNAFLNIGPLVAQSALISAGANAGWELRRSADQFDRAAYNYLGAQRHRHELPDDDFPG